MCVWIWVCYVQHGREHQPQDLELLAAQSPDVNPGNQTQVFSKNSKLLNHWTFSAAQEESKIFFCLVRWWVFIFNYFRVYLTQPTVKEHNLHHYTEKSIKKPNCLWWIIMVLTMQFYKWSSWTICIQWVKLWCV